MREARRIGETSSRFRSVKMLEAGMSLEVAGGIA
jgi:hypothetical protein